MEGRRIRRYKTTNAREYIRQIGFDAVDEHGLNRLKEICFREGWTQEQFDMLVREHAWTVKRLFSPSKFGWVGRLQLAAHFLFNPKGW